MLIVRSQLKVDSVNLPQPFSLFGLRDQYEQVSTQDGRERKRKN